MAVPKTPVDENHLLQSWKNEVRPAHKIFAVETEPISKAVSYAPNCEFRCRVFLLDALHYASALLWRARIDHRMRSVLC